MTLLLLLAIGCDALKVPHGHPVIVPGPKIEWTSEAPVFMHYAEPGPVLTLSADGTCRAKTKDGEMTELHPDTCDALFRGWKR